MTEDQRNSGSDRREGADRRSKVEAIRLDIFKLLITLCHRNARRGSCHGHGLCRLKLLSKRLASDMSIADFLPLTKWTLFFKFVRAAQIGTVAKTAHDCIGQ